ncbi:MAG: hypothetical protein ACRC2V_15620, partial [Xenococcaceae cyanobacterium]
ELERQGYLIRNQSRNQKGQFSNATYTIYEFPIEDIPDREKPETEPRRQESATGKPDPILNTDIRSNDLNEVLKDEILIFPEGTEKKESPPIPVKTTSWSSQAPAATAGVPTTIDLEPDRADGKEQIESVSPTESTNKTIPVVNSEILEKKEVSVACNTSVRKTVSDPHFGNRQNTLALQKQRAIAATINLGEFESKEEEDEFFGAAIDQMLKDNPKLSSGQAQKDAMWMIARLRGEGNVAKTRQDDLYLALFRSRQLGNISFEEVKRRQAKEDNRQKALAILSEIQGS